MAPRVAFVFPGQGSQRVGMGDALKALWPGWVEHLALAEAAVRGAEGSGVTSSIRFASHSEATPDPSAHSIRFASHSEATSASSAALRGAPEPGAGSGAPPGRLAKRNEGGVPGPAAGVGAPLGVLIDEGPVEELARTQNAQPALLLVSYGWDRVLRERGLAPDVVAGHSLGEYSALVAAGALDFETAVALVARRGRLMAEAATGSDGAMAAVLGLDAPAIDLERLAELAGRPLAIEIANINSPGQVVISGPKDDIEAAAAPLARLGARRVVPLAVSGAFHSSAMAPAAAVFEELLRAARMTDAHIPVVQNTTAAPATSAADLSAALGRQMTGSVLWRQSVEAMAADGVGIFVEVGPGAVLKGLIRRTVPDATAYAVDDPADRDSVFASADAGRTPAARQGVGT